MRQITAARVIRTFLEWLKKTAHLKPLWLLVGKQTEEFLGEKLGWRTLSCVAEERADPTKAITQHDRGADRKIRHAVKEGVQIIDLPPEKPVPADFQEKCDARVKEWVDSRQGKQVHLTELTLWRDMEHRRYFYAKDQEEKICALVVLARLAPEYGFQVKWALDFPGAPSGTIEHIILHALEAAKAAGAKQVTFGGSAVDSLTPGHNLSGLDVKALSHTYHTLTSKLKLLQKGEFREKLGAEEDALYICFPRHGLGVRGARTIVKFIED